MFNAGTLQENVGQWDAMHCRSQSHLTQTKCEFFLTNSLYLFSHFPRVCHNALHSLCMYIVKIMCSERQNSLRSKPSMNCVYCATVLGTPGWWYFVLSTYAFTERETAFTVVKTLSNTHSLPRTTLMFSFTSNQ